MTRSRRPDWEKARAQDRARAGRRRPKLLTQKPPTPKQQRYLRSLARQTRTTFTPPRSAWEASQEIDRLRKLLEK